MILFLGCSHPSITEHAGEPNLGRLVQPRDCAQVAATAELMPWAADNDAFNGWGEEAARRYTRMLDAIAGVPRCQFVTLPDVVGDARATAVRFSEWLVPVKSRGLPVALVLQDGVEEVGVPWDKVDAVFVGGSTEFKLGEVAHEFVVEALRRDKWVHMGRVNTPGRVMYAKSIGCHSFDGTGFSTWRKINLPQGLAWAAAPPQLRIV